MKFLASARMSKLRYLALPFSISRLDRQHHVHMERDHESQRMHRLRPARGRQPALQVCREDQALFLREYDQAWRMPERDQGGMTK